MGRANNIIDSLIGNIQTLFPTLFITKDSYFDMASSVINAEITSYTTGTDLTGTYYLLNITDNNLNTFIDRGINLTKYLGTIDGYNEVNITTHVKIGTIDQIKVYGVTSIVLEKIDLELINGIYVFTQPVSIPFDSRYSSKVQIEAVVFNVKTKRDGTRERLNDYTNIIEDFFYEKKGVIRLQSGENINLYKDVIKTEIINENSNIQSRNIIVNVWYTVIYNK